MGCILQISGFSKKVLTRVKLGLAFFSLMGLGLWAFSGLNEITKRYTYTRKIRKKMNAYIRCDQPKIKRLLGFYIFLHDMDTQSVHAVEYNDDLLIEILVRLPVISVVLFKSVCKRWLSLIRDPTFHLRRSQSCNLDPPSGVLLQKYGRSHGYDFVSFDTRIPCKSSMLKNPFHFSSELHDAKILQSCNGLLLLRCSNTKADKYEYYVYNPCINLLKVVPECSMKSVYSARIAFDPSKSPHYKVIDAVLVLNDVDDDDYDNRFSVQIRTYSSKTDMWSVCSGRYGDSFLYFYYGIYWNDALYWHNNQDNNPLLFKLDTNVEHQALTTIKFPRTLDGKVSLQYCKLFETSGCLLLLCRKYGCPRLFDVYEMRKGYSEWSLKYRVNLNDDVSRPRRSVAFVYSIVLGEREEDSFIVIQECQKIYQYKPVLKTYHDLYDLESIDKCHSFQFIASFAGVGL